MKHGTKLLFITILTTLLVSCFDPEEFPESPFIELESLQYKDTDGFDSLILSFRFEDGDGNLGLNDQISDLEYPYQIYSFIFDNNGLLVNISNDTLVPPFSKAPVLIALASDGLLTYFVDFNRLEVISETDNRPAYDCENYEIIGPDTIFVERNEFYHNFHIDFYRKRSGVYSQLDFRSIFQSDDCELGNFNGRIPFFDPNGKEGVITYAMLSQAFRLAFLDDTIQARFWIYDRDLNKSNVIETPDFVLEDLL